MARNAALCRNMPQHIARRPKSRANGTWPVIHVFKFACDMINGVNSLNSSYFAVSIRQPLFSNPVSFGGWGRGRWGQLSNFTHVKEFSLSHGSAETSFRCGLETVSNFFKNMCTKYYSKSLGCCRRSARLAMSVEILSTAAKLYELECGPMPNVMAALPNIGGALCSTPQSLADAQYWSVVQ